MATLSFYLQKWNLKLSTNKTMSAALHLYNKEVRRELKMSKGRPYFLCRINLPRQKTG